MAGNEPSARPLSPHLQVYKWAPSMAVSIFHRITGDGIAIAGGLMFLWWLGAIAADPDWQDRERQDRANDEEEDATNHHDDEARASGRGVVPIQH